MAQFWIQYQAGGLGTYTLYYSDVGANYSEHSGNAVNTPQASGLTLDGGSLISNIAANALISSNPQDVSFSGSNDPIYLFYEQPAAVDQQIDVYFYPDNRTRDEVIDQQVDVYFYPDNNVQEEQVNSSEIKVWVYPDGNIRAEELVASSGFKFWFGMKGKRRYGNGLSRRIKI